MSVDLKSAATAVPKLIAQSLAASDTVIYTCPAGVTATVRKIRVTNVDGSPRNVTLSIVNSGGVSGVTNRLMVGESVSNGVRVDLGGGDVLNEGDFISGFAPSSTNVDVLISIIEFGGATGGGLTGIQNDAIGTGGHGTASVTGTNTIGTGANRYLFGALLVQPTAIVGWASYTSLSMSCTDGAMTRLASVDFNNGSSIGGSVHLFGRANPTSGSTQTLTAAAAASGSTMALVLGSFSKSGVASITGAATEGPVGAAAMSLAVTSATGHVPVFAAAFNGPPQDFNLRTRYFNGIPSTFNVAQWLLMADAIGASTVTGTTSNSTTHCSVGVDVVPA